MLGLFFSKLDVAFSLTMDGWSNRNPEDFYVVTAHKVDIKTLAPKSILLTILDVECGTCVGRRVGTALFEHLKGMGTGVLTRLLNVVSDNGSYTIAAVRRLFQLINASVGFEHMYNFNHVRRGDHSIQLVVIKLLSFTKKSMESLHDALVKIRHKKVMRQQYRLEVAAAGFSSKKPTHMDTPTRWNSTHHMSVDAFEKRVVIDSSMEQFAIYISRTPLCDDQWQMINDVITFLRTPRQVMQNLAVDLRSTPNSLPLSIAHLVKHYETNELQLLAINPRITVTKMGKKIEEYEKLIVLYPAIVAAYLNPQIAKPSDPVELKKLIDLIRSTLQRRYWAKLQFRNTTVESEVSTNSLFQAPFQPESDSSMLDEIPKVPANRAIGLDIVIKIAIKSSDKDNTTDEIEDVVNQLEIEQDYWYEEVFDDRVVQILNSQFEALVFESNMN
ncbi:hypothetical protein AXG93_3310s1190 [Marchantia polymorpha subsp. ruderalis]|uniref:DUF659 domain-containing protein n=1 Tax=Marchantia polymorpha subsp. ruderalis TaxID=1480154 RepID=A0A176W0X9_MARPO|nr:hypothetical protein AXG93_3310s1190 [Marchantia polymorpha subsp. ruderalis]